MQRQAAPSPSTSFISIDAFLEHWQGHRRLTRRVIEAFPEDAFATYSIGGMRTFAALVGEMLGMSVPTFLGVATGKWDYDAGPKPTSKAEVFQMWDEVTTKMNEIWPTILRWFQVGRFQVGRFQVGRFPS